MTLNVFRFITLFSATAFLALSSFIYVKDSSSRLNRAFAVWVLFCALWSFGFFLTMFRVPHEVALWSSRVSHFFGGLTAILFLRFVLIFLDVKRKVHPIHYILAACTGVSSVTPWMITDVPPKLFFPYYPEPGVLYLFLLASFFLTYLKAFGLLLEAFRNQDLDKSKRMQSLSTLIGVFLAWVNVATLFLPIYHFQITPQLILFPLIGVATVYAIIRYRFLDIRVVITRAGLLLVIYFVVLGTPFLVGLWGRFRLERWIGREWWLVPLGLCTALATAGPFAYAYLRRQAEARLLREQWRYQRTLQRAARGMTQVRDVTKLSELITRIVSRSVRVSHASLFLWDKPNERYVLRASHGPKRLALQSRYGLESSHALVRWLAEHRRVLSEEETVRYPDIRINQEMQRLEAELAIPGLIEHRLVGFLVLGAKLSGAGYSMDDLHAFAMLANEAAMALENASSYEELIKVNEQLKSASERLLFQERLAAAGQFAMGMAHEIKNPLSAIKTFAQYLPEKYADPAFREKFFRVVQVEIDRINTIVKELSDFAKPAPLQLQPVRLSALIDDTLTLLSNQCLKQGIEVHAAFSENGLSINADSQQLKQVLLNLFLNSLEAMPQGGRLEVATRVSKTHLILCVSDTGHGIDSERQREVWDPFFTTKERGMGLGLAIVKGVVERHGGQISLASTPNQGTQVEILLPISV